MGILMSFNPSLEKINSTTCSPLMGHSTATIQRSSSSLSGRIVVHLPADHNGITIIDGMSQEQVKTWTKTADYDQADSASFLKIDKKLIKQTDKPVCYPGYYNKSSKEDSEPSDDSFSLDSSDSDDHFELTMLKNKMRMGDKIGKGLKPLNNQH